MSTFWWILKYLRILKDDYPEGLIAVNYLHEIEQASFYRSRGKICRDELNWLNWL